jgi:hypothetical protein
MIGIQKRLGRRIANDVYPSLPMVEQVPYLLVRSPAVSFTRKLSLNPCGFGVRIGQSPTRKGKLAGTFPAAVCRAISPP